MSGRIRRLLRTLPIGGVDLGDVPTLAAAPPRVAGNEGFSPAAALARRLLAEQLGQAAPERCCVLGPGRLVRAETLPLCCRLERLSVPDSVPLELDDLEWLVVGDALAAADDPPAVLQRIVAAMAGQPALRLLVVLPGTALLPDDEPPCARRWLYSAVSGTALAREVLGERAGPVIVRGNVLAASSELLGIGAERLWPDELAANDPEYPMVVALTTRT